MDANESPVPLDDPTRPAGDRPKTVPPPPPGSPARDEQDELSLLLAEDPPRPWVYEEALSRGANRAEETQPNARAPGASPHDLADEAPALMSKWVYQEIRGQLDLHDEWFCHAGVTPENLKVIGARVRGVSHKHNGTNCDDWFKFDVSGSWTIIAVSDGAGSAYFSRIGASEACKAAVRRLANDLRDFRVDERPTKDQPVEEKDLEFVRESLHKAMSGAYEAVEAAARTRVNTPEHEAMLAQWLLEQKKEPHKPGIKDLSCTLLLAVHATVKFQGSDYSLVVSCQIGDGMIVAVDHKGAQHLLAVPDKGGYGGETVFLNDKRQLEQTLLASKTRFLLCQLRALMVMTDGVADIYFPNETEMLSLYGDLVLNQILPSPMPAKESIAGALRRTGLPTLDSVRSANYHEVMGSITPSGFRQVRVALVKQYADRLGLPVADVVASAPLLSAGALGTRGGGPILDETRPQERLRVWLDSFIARGERDDRALVVLYREGVA